MIGTTISHYKILEKLGEGGMGVVYKAQDLKLDRLVALKLLPPHLAADENDKQRFIHEAKAASALDHPNICTVYEIDETPDDGGRLFLAMAYYDGQTIKHTIKERPLPIGEALRIAIIAAEGLATAHAKAIVHRDIKSDNLMLTRDGTVKIMDFGLAKRAGATMLTKAGTTVGTVPYMSPEQARGETVDHRTDIWSLGVVLYEMVSGRLPFKSDYSEATVYSILNEAPPPLTSLRSDVSPELERIVNKAMRKDVGERYQHIDEMATDLRALKKQLETGKLETISAIAKPNPKSKLYAYGIAAVMLVGLILGAFFFYSRADRPIDSIAVLPFENVAADPNTEYLSDGITESIINRLSQLSNIRVIPRTTAFQYKGKDDHPLDVGKILKVRAVLTGKLIQRGNSLNIQVDLVDVDKESQLWGDQYNRTLIDVLPVEDDIVKEITNELRVKLSGGGGAQLAARSTTSPEAYRLYLEGLYFWNKRTDDGMVKAREYFQQALDLDPKYALAYVGIADCYAVGPHANPELSQEQIGVDLKGAVMKALALNDNLAEAHTALGMVKANEFDFAGEEKEYRRAIELNPNYPTAYHWLAEFLVFMGRFDEGLAEYRLAIDIDPLSLAIRSDYGIAHYYARQYDQAIVELKKAIDMDPGFVRTHFYLSDVYWQKGMYDEAVKEIARGQAAAGNSDKPIDSIKKLYASLNRKDLGARQRDSLKKIASQHYLYRDAFGDEESKIGRREEILRWVESQYKHWNRSLIGLKVDPVWDPFRSDPRFKAVMEKMKFEQ